jgi:hypothetical protein
MTTVSTKDSGDTTDYISTITVKNNTQYPITRDGEPVTDDGQYQSYPPIEIDPGKEATWVMKGIHSQLSLNIPPACAQFGVGFRRERRGGVGWRPHLPRSLP